MTVLAVFELQSKFQVLVVLAKSDPESLLLTCSMVCRNDCQWILLDSEYLQKHPSRNRAMMLTATMIRIRESLFASSPFINKVYNLERVLERKISTDLLILNLKSAKMCCIKIDLQVRKCCYINIDHWQ
jgi:hypothetical protein